MMPRNLRHSEHVKATKGRREYALQRNELRGPSEERTAAAGPMSPSIKVNPDADLIERFLADRKRGQ